MQSPSPDAIPQLHQQAIILDAHNDTLALKLSRRESLDLGPDNPRYHVDRRRLHEGGVTALFTYVGARDLAQSLELWDGLYYNLETYPQDFALARDAAEVRAAKQASKIAFIGQLESCTCLQNRLALLRMQHRLGLRVANLTHGEGQDREETALQVDSSDFGYCTEEEHDTARRNLRGLTAFGRETVAACNELGLIVDLAHANVKTFYEAVELSSKPCIFSHGCVFAITPHWRGLTDDQIKALAVSGGVMGVAFYTKFIHQHKPSMEKLMDQVVHVVDLVGPDHVGIGSDFDGLPEEEIPIPPHIGRLGEFTTALAGRGFSEETILKILGGNFLRVMKTVCG